MLFLLATTLAAEQRVSFQKVAFRPTRAQQIEAKKRTLVQKVANFYHRKLQTSRNAGHRHLLGMGAPEPDMEDQPLYQTGVSLKPGDLALRILNSYHDLGCNYSLDPHLIDDLIQSLSNYELKLTKIKDGSAYRPTDDNGWVDPTGQPTDVEPTPVVQNQGRRVRRNLRTNVIAPRGPTQLKSETYYRYSSFQGSAFHNPFNRWLSDSEFPSGEGQAVKYARCIPEEAPLGLETPKISKAALVAYKTDFNSLNSQYTNLFVPLNLETGANAQGPSPNTDMKEFIVMANNIMQSHKELEDQITALGTKADDFKLTKNEALTMWGLIADYNQAKLKADVNSPVFAEKDANLANICTTFQTTFETIDSDLEALLTLNDELEVASRDLASVDQTNIAHMQTASVAIPKINQIANQIVATLAKIEQSLQTTDTLEKEAGDALHVLQGLTTSASAIQQTSTKGIHIPAAAATLTLALLSLL